MSWRKLEERDAAIVRSVETTTVIFGRDDLVALVMTGKHRTRFLHAVTTQDVNGMAPGACQRNTLCTAKGALIGWWRQVSEPNREVLWTDRKGASALATALMSYRVAERVKLQETDDLALIEVIGAEADKLAQAVGLELPAADMMTSAATSWNTHAVRTWATPMGGRTRDGVSGWSVQVPREAMGELAGALMGAGAKPGCHAAREVLRIQQGVPRLAIDMPADSGTTPLELGLSDAVSLDKGCYLGHEALAMQSWRGQLRRHLTWLRAEPDSESAKLPPAGVKMRTSAGKRAGWTGGGYELPDGERIGLGLVQRRAYVVDSQLHPVDSDAVFTVLGTTTPEVFSA